MSVLKSKRKASQFEVFHHLTKMRKEITDLLLRDFGYSFEKAESRLVKRFGGKTYEELNEADKKIYDRLKARWEAFDEWFIEDERKAVADRRKVYGQAPEYRRSGCSDRRYRLPDLGGQLYQNRQGAKVLCPVHGRQLCNQREQGVLGRAEKGSNLSCGVNRYHCKPAQDENL